ncbi:hypothetical protein F442_11303 [Phytophthora nicotianae P10297]|uniref:Uncharacterized protein n=1 Tax=Phytophthora nicotianae P10297 TaxID=1317064 RepID=W2Z386_PHYNI|nr:hypothetical protein F442_11303 [Phytophthora nicotianae P10297]
MQVNKKNPEAGFAIIAMMEIPVVEQYKMIQELGMIQ